MTGAAISSMMYSTMYASVAAMAVGAGVSAYSAYQQGKAAEQQAKAEAAQQEYQAKLNEERAAVAQIQGEQEAAKRSRAMAAEIGSQYANYAGNGLMVDGAGKDTLGDVLKTTVTEAEADIKTIRDNTAMNVWTYKSNAAAQRASAKNSLIAGKNARTTGTLKAWGTGLSGLGEIGKSATTLFGGA